MPDKTLESYWLQIVNILEAAEAHDHDRFLAFTDHFADTLDEDGKSTMARRVREITKRIEPTGNRVGIHMIRVADAPQPDPRYSQPLGRHPGRRA